MQFLKDYWLWILLPFVMVLGGLGILYWMSGGSSFSDFTYHVF